MTTRAAKSPDYYFLALIAGLVIFGLVMLLSASTPLGYDQFGDSYYYLKHQVIFGLIPGMAFILIFSFIPYFFWKKHAWNLLILSIVLLVLVFIPGLSAGIGTAHSWISVGNVFSVQPSELVKLTFLFYLAAWLEQRNLQGHFSKMPSGLLPFFGMLAAILLLLILQPDIGTMVIIAAMSLVVYFVAETPLLYVLGLLGVGITGIALLIGLAPYRAARFTTFLHPELDPLGIGYHINQALLAIGSGGFFGLGYGHSRQKFEYLPEVAGDSIFAVIGEELGFIISALVVLVFVLMIWRAIKIAGEAPDPFSKYVVIGIAAWFAFQAFLNIGSMVAIFPMTGVPLPLISYGGTSLAISLAAAGVILNVSRYTR